MNPPEFENEASLFSLSGEFLEAAAILYETPPIKFNVSIVTYYLLGHSAELLLKSFLYKRGVPIEDLKKKYGHDLSKLVNSALEKGLSPAVPVQNIVNLSVAYAPKQLEYRQLKAMQFPALDALLQEVRVLKQHVFNHVAEF